MKKLLLVTLCLSLFSAAFAEENGFSGYLDLGVLGMSSTDALMVSGNNEDIDGTGENADRFGKGIAVLLFDVNYRKDDLIYHIGSPAEGAEPKLKAGISKLYGSSKVDVSFVIDPMGSVWEDPYIDDRDDTAQISAGISVSYEPVRRPGVFGDITVYKHDIDNDEIGERFSEMERDGYTYELTAGYKQPVSKGFLKPFVKLTHDSRDGDVQSSKGADLGILAARMFPQGRLIAALSAGYTKFDEENPVFDETRKDVNAKAFINYKWQNPFGFENKHISFITGVSNRSSNIDFYDAVTYFGGVTFGFDF